MNTKPFSLVLLLLLLTIVSPLTSARKLFAETQVSASGDLGHPAATGHIGYNPLKKKPICNGSRYSNCIPAPPKRPCTPYSRHCN
nr:uncharacterized protein LOC113765518 isoform X2 [Ipomoea batatas]